MCNTNDTPDDSILCPVCGVGELAFGDCGSCDARICSGCGEYPVSVEHGELCVGCIDDAEQERCTDEEYAAELDAARDADRDGGERPSAEECGV